MVVAEMVEIPAGRFRMGSARFYPEEGPVREIEVDGFAIDRGPVTVAEFARFVDETGYMTLAEQPPDPADYPDADPSLLVAGSAVFHPTPGPRAPRRPERGGRTSPARTGAIPGAGQRQRRSARITPSRTSRTRTPRRSRGGRARSCRPRPSGSTRRAAASTGRRSPGETTSDRAAS